MSEKNITKPELIKDRNLLIVKNLSSFYKKKKILNKVSIQIKEGEIVGLLGPNGAGKTTCFQSIAGLQNVSHGSIKLNGLNITDLPIYKELNLNKLSSSRNFNISRFIRRTKYNVNTAIKQFR